jgi:hypothetical protein
MTIIPAGTLDASVSPIPMVTHGSILFYGIENVKGFMILIVNTWFGNDAAARPKREHSVGVR